VLHDQQHAGPGLGHGADHRGQPVDHHRGQSQRQLVDQEELRAGRRAPRRAQPSATRHRTAPWPTRTAAAPAPGTARAPRRRPPAWTALRSPPGGCLHGQVRQQPASLRHDRDARRADLLRAGHRQFGTAQGNRPRPRPQHATNGEDHGGLARVVRAEKGSHLSGGPGEAHVLDHTAAASTQRELARRLAHPAFPPSRSPADQGGDIVDDRAQVRGLLVGQPGGRFVEQDQPGLPATARATSARRRCPARRSAPAAPPPRTRW
jgi:hypothetical protein